MNIRVQRAEYKEIETLRDLYRHEAGCQVVRDSILRRGMADPYLIFVEDRVAGYGGVWNKYDPGRIMEFYTLPHLRRFAQPMFQEFMAVSQATQIEAQTNIPWMLTLLYDYTKEITEEAILFHDAVATNLVCPNGVFRRTTPDDAELAFPHQSEPLGDWVLEADGAIVATGGFLCHYNPPYGDVFMEVSEPTRRQGFGSYLVQEVKRVCYEAGKKPAARCNPTNIASRRTLEKAGFLPCGRILAGKLDNCSF